jgi:hypothetical protein
MKKKTKNKAVRVGCWCGWRGLRVMGECACYDEWALSCHCHWGRCPKCNNPIYTMDTIKDVKKDLKEHNLTRPNIFPDTTMEY